MAWLIIIGTIISALGLIGLVISALRVLRAKRAGLDDAALKDAVQKAMVLNMAAFAFSAFGLMLVIVGIFLS